MSEYFSQEMLNIVRDAMKQHPTGILVAPDNQMKTISAIQWNQSPQEKDVLFAMLLTSIACVAIKGGILTSAQIIDSINEAQEGDIKVIRGEVRGGFND